MPGYRLTTPAKRDLTDILHYLLENAGGRIAKQVQEDLQAGFRSLALNPGLGHLREDLSVHPVLFLLVGSYFIVYRASQGQLWVHAILHHARDLELTLLRRKV